jgi:hypothetical protein
VSRRDHSLNFWGGDWRRLSSDSLPFGLGKKKQRAERWHYRSEGLSPVSFAIRASILGPISSDS